MGKQQNKGFTLIEVLVCLLIISLILLFSMNSFIKFSNSYFNPVYYQLEAMATKKRTKMDSVIWFNENGNINQARTIKINNKKCVFQLGMGRFRCE